MMAVVSLGISAVATAFPAVRWREDRRFARPATRRAARRLRGTTMVDVDQCRYNQRKSALWLGTITTGVSCPVLPLSAGCAPNDAAKL